MKRQQQTTYQREVRHSDRSRENLRNRAYIEGNTVRKLAPVPREKREQAQRRNKQQMNFAARRNREKAMQMSFGYVAFLSIISMAAVFVCAAYIRLQSDITSRLNRISVLENSLVDLRADNDAAMKRLHTSIDYEEIKNKAMNELGMIYPTENQIQYYNINSKDYLNQYEDIPKN